jgi:group I intron endonuclease
MDKHHSAKLQNSWNKHGAGCFIFDVIEYIEDKTMLVEREQFWIDHYKAATVDGYNICPKAGSPLGVKHTAETRAKVSAANIGRKMSPESVARGAAARTGRKNSPESIARMTGKIYSEERRINISKGKLGKKLDPLKIAKRSERKFSQSHIENISIAMKGRKMSVASIAKRHASRMANGGFGQSAESIAKREATKKANRLIKLGNTER